MANSSFKYSEVFTTEAINRFHALLRQGKVDQAVWMFVRLLPLEWAYKWEQSVRAKFAAGVARELKLAEINKIATDISLITRSTLSDIGQSVRVFSTDVVAKYYFQINGITKSSYQKAILDATVGQFESYITGSMANTPANVLNDIRTIQREWIQYNANRIRFKGDADKLLYKSEADFKAMLQKKYPSVYKQIEEGKLLRSRSFGKNLDKYKSYTLEEYLDMSVRATVLNIDRNSTEMACALAGNKVVEYITRDTRSVTEEREVCNHILGKKIHGKSLVAMDRETAQQLGIYSIDQAKELGAFAVNCRHSIRTLDASYLNSLNKALYLKQESTYRQYVDSDENEE